MEKEVLSILEFDKIIEHLIHLPVSPLGQKHVQELERLTDLSLIEKKLKQVTELRDILDFDDPFPISGLKDITPEIDKIQLEGSYLSPEELTRVSQTLKVGRRISDYLKKRKENYPLLARICVSIFVFKEIEKEITRCVDLATYELFDHASAELNRIRRSIKSQEEQIRKKLESMLSTFSGKGYLQESLIAVRNGRLVLMVKDEHRRRVKGLVHDQSATGATLFVEPMESLELGNKIRTLKIEEKREVERILLKLTSLIRNNIVEVADTVNSLGKIDFIYAKARFSRELQAFQPAINSNNKLEIIKGKHPLLVLRYGTERDVVPFDLAMGERFNSLVISGPNAGGKTVALKTIGLLSLMVSCGLHIPADPSSNVAIFKNIFARIGDQQSLENDLSTFSSHVAALKNITDNADRKNLVLIDEIGSGTDPDEGAALAIAVIEKLTSIGSLTIVSTHQGALKVFAHETDFVENGSMEFNRDTLEPTYRFRLGIPGSSYGYEIAQRLGVAEEITTRARELVGEKKTQVEALLTDLEERLLKYQNLTTELSQKESRLNSLLKLYDRKVSEIKDRESLLKKEAAKEAEQILKSANVTLERAVKQIREQQASREAIRNSKELIRQEREKIKQQSKKVSERKSQPGGTKEPLKKVEIGQEVFWQTFNSRGLVVSLPDSSGRVMLQTGEVKIKAPLNELFPVAETKKRKAGKARVNISANLKNLTSNEIDIRGCTVEEGIAVIDKFLDEALISGFDQVYVIHGKGTGSLRKGIYTFLDKHPRVKSRNFPEWSLGDTGMSVVKLK